MLAGVPHGSILGPLLLLVILMIYLKISSTAKLFADDTFFTVVHAVSLSSLQINDDLIKISTWICPKMSFNPEVTKQAQDVVFFS